MTKRRRRRRKNAKKGAAGAEKCKNGAPQAPKKWKNDHQKIENFGPRKQGVALINPPPLWKLKFSAAGGQRGGVFYLEHG